MALQAVRIEEVLATNGTDETLHALMDQLMPSETGCVFVSSSTVLASEGPLLAVHIHVASQKVILSEDFIT